MAFDEKGFLTTLTEKTVAGSIAWTPGIAGATNPPTLYSVQIGDYRADIVSLDDGLQVWAYDAMDRLAQIDCDQKFVDGIATTIVAVEPEAKEEPVSVAVRKEAMATAVAAYVKPEEVKEEGSV